MSQPETVKFELEVPKKLWDALTWYAQRTDHWISYDLADKSYNALIIDMVASCMKAESENPLIAIDWLKNVLRTDYELD